MCTLVVLKRAGHEWPLIIAANRDEKRDRPWTEPGRHWPDRAHVVAGRDDLANGSWLGVNDDGMVAGVLNRTGTLGPDPDRRSRGELPLEALDHAQAEAAAEALENLDPLAYRPFNLFIGDTSNAYWICSEDTAGAPAMRVRQIPEGVSMLTDRELNDATSARVRLYLPRFQNAPQPQPEKDEWGWWQALMADREFEPGGSPGGAMNVDMATHSKGDFGTVSSSLIGLHRTGKMRWLFAPGAPDKAAYEAVKL